MTVGYPSIRSGYTEYFNNSSTTAHRPPWPTTMVIGDTVVCVFSRDQEGLVTFPAGWTKFATNDHNNRVQQDLAWYKVVGGESGTFLVTTNNNQQVTAAVLVFSGASNPDVEPPLAGGGSNSLVTGDTVLADLPSFSPAPGSGKYLWGAFIASNRNDPVTTFPANMTLGPQVAVRGGFAGGAYTGGDFHEVDAASFDPDSFTIDFGGSEWAGSSFVIRPGPTGLAEGSSTTAAAPVVAESGDGLAVGTSFAVGIPNTLSPAVGLAEGTAVAAASSSSRVPAIGLAEGTSLVEATGRGLKIFWVPQDTLPEALPVITADDDIWIPEEPF